MLRVIDVAKLLRLSEKTIRRRIKDGTIPARRIGRAVRIPEEAVKALTAASLHEVHK